MLRAALQSFGRFALQDFGRCRSRYTHIEDNVFEELTYALILSRKVWGQGISSDLHGQYAGLTVKKKERIKHGIVLNLAPFPDAAS